jgi:hypothetical protein
MDVKGEDVEEEEEAGGSWAFAISSRQLEAPIIPIRGAN